MADTCTCEHTGECRVAMSGPTCRNPDCPPCQTPELRRDPGCLVHGDERELCPRCKTGHLVAHASGIELCQGGCGAIYDGRGLLGQAPPAEGEERFEGHEGRECGEHRTLGRRAWCFECTEYCYPEFPCRGCELPQLRATLASRDEVIARAVEGLKQSAKKGCWRVAKPKNHPQEDCREMEAHRLRKGWSSDPIPQCAACEARSTLAAIGEGEDSE